ATGSRVAAIVPVHLYGQSADMAPILELAGSRGIPVVEDACQAHGATCRLPDGREAPCGSMGDAAAFSFYPGKNLGAMGEAGAVTTSDEGIARAARMLRDHGQSEKYVHVTALGSNARMDAIQAAALGLKLPRLLEWNDRRREIAARYDERCRDAGIRFVPEVGRGRHVYHLYVVRVADRDALRDRLSEAGVHTGLHYPIPLHLQEAYAELGYEHGSLPETEAAAASVLSLPMYPHMTVAMADRVMDALVRELSV
ncbi:MAG: DegT/DnrJ/EryC1/StrS family aminotransferase, partial [Gemmatimonadota bacterium]